MADIFVHTSYYILSALFLCWIFFLVNFLKKAHFSPQLFFLSYWPGIFSALVLSLFVFLTVPVGYKVLNDETLLLSIANSMFQKQDIDCAVMALNFGEYTVLETLIPKRPLLFPYFVSFFHAILGFHAWNVFAFNFIVLILILSGVYIVSRNFVGGMAATAAQFLVLSYPILSISATSGGYDLLSLFFFLLSLAMFYRYLSRPGPEISVLLWLTLIMFINIRYESVAFLFVICVAAFCCFKFSFFKKYAGVYLLSTLFFLPFVGQRILTQGKYENPVGVALFSVESFMKYLVVYIENFMNLDMFLPYNGFLNIVSLLISCILAGAIIQEKVTLPYWQKHFWVTVMACLLLHLVIILSHHFGRYDEPSQARLFLFSSFLFAVVPIIFLIVHKKIISGRKILGMSILLFFFYHPIAMDSKIMKSLVLPRSFADGRLLLGKIANENVTVISYLPIMYTSLGYASVDFNYANHHQEVLKKGLQGQHNKILSFQLIDSETRVPLAGQELSSDFILDPIAVRPFSDNIVMLVSSVAFAKY